MPVLVPGFAHLPGVSCGPTAARNALAAHGVPLTEALVFGLGGGLGFYYLPSSAGLSRTFIGRRMGLEQDVCALLGLEWRELREPDPARAWERVQARIDARQVAVLTTDLKELPYSGASSPYNGHLITLAGYDLARDLALVADTDRPGLLELARADLARARASEAFPYGPHQHSWFEVHGGPARPLAEVVPEGVRRAGRLLLEDPSGFGGLSALQAFAEELPAWPALPDFERCAREGYNAVEKRGTGGGLFRALFAQFLDEAQALRPELGLKPLAHGYRELAWEWGELATAMKLAAQDRAWDNLPEHAARLLERERQLAERTAGV